MKLRKDLKRHVEAFLQESPSEQETGGFLLQNGKGRDREFFTCS